jgi:1-acyl-sn-glycerol-3-phosphate acyltransferase
MRGWRSYLLYEGCYWAFQALGTLGLSYRFEGRRNVPRRGPALLIANHESYFDPVLVGMASSRQICYLARKTLFNNKVFGAFLRTVRTFPVDQEGVAKEGLKTVLELLKAGEVVLIFPEGERTWDGEMQPLKPGVQLLVKRTQAPVIPVGVAGAFQALPRQRKLPRLSPLFLPATGAAVAVSVGEPRPAARYADLPRDQLLVELAREIGVMRERAERLRRKP